MRLQPNSRPGSGRQEEGFLLLGVLFLVLLVTLALAIAAPKMAESIRRDKEVETVHRGMQYARAIQIYFNKYGRYPNTIDQLVKSDNQRFLRKRYLDPMTGKDDWRIIHYGEAKVPAQGLFGQTVGITPTGATNGAGSTGIDGSSSQFGGSGSSLGGGSGSLGSSGSGFGSSGSSFGAGSSTSPFGNSGSSTSPFSTGGSSTSTTGGTDSGSGSGGTSTTGANNIGGTQTTGGSGSAFGSPGVSVGGAPIVGVGLLDKKTSIKIYKKQTHYNQWEFVYDPNQNTAIASGGTTNGSGTSSGAGMTGSTGVNGGASGGFSLGNGSGAGSNNGSGFGSSNGSGFGGSNDSGFGGSSGSGFGGSPTSPVSPNAPVNNSPQ
jgi:type II secretory pathway pseudopilin PulG